MKTETPRLQYPAVELRGDLAVEDWPQDVEDFMRALASQLRAQGLRVERLITVTVPPDPNIDFLIGNDQESRRVRIHTGDPRGVIYLVYDDGTKDPDRDYNNTVDHAVTASELLRDPRGILELDKHKNNRLNDGVYRHAVALG